MTPWEKAALSAVQTSAQAAFQTTSQVVTHLTIIFPRPKRSGFTGRGFKGYLARKKPPPPLGPPQEPNYDPIEGPYGVAVSYVRGTSLLAT